jgi:hypothetical protein
MPGKYTSKQKIIAVSMILGIGLFAYGVYYNQQCLAQGRTYFYQNDVKGKITDISNARSIIVLKLKGEGDRDFIFTQQPADDKRQRFYKAVHRGDSIYKKAYSDTITIVNKQAEVSRYLVEKPGL